MKTKRTFGYYWVLLRHDSEPEIGEYGEATVGTYLDWHFGGCPVKDPHWHFPGSKRCVEDCDVHRVLSRVAPKRKRRAA
jgi:hypothetical protein